MRIGSGIRTELGTDTGTGFGTGSGTGTGIGLDQDDYGSQQSASSTWHELLLCCVTDPDRLSGQPVDCSIAHHSAECVSRHHGAGCKHARGIDHAVLKCPRPFAPSPRTAAAPGPTCSTNLRTLAVEIGNGVLLICRMPAPTFFERFFKISSVHIGNGLWIQSGATEFLHGAGDDSLLCSSGSWC